LPKSRVGAHVIALGDVSVAGKEIAVTHTRHAFVKTDWGCGFASLSLVSFASPIQERDFAVFDVPGRSALRRDAGGQPAAGLMLAHL
jgi:hypothetical protein